MKGLTVRVAWVFLPLALAAASVGNWNVAAQARIHAYPRGGQSVEQQRRDEFECHQWAVQRTGFNPITATPPRQRADRGDSGVLGIGGDRNVFGGEGNVVSDAATGAAIGAAGGAIAGDAGLGAIIGAGVSAVFGDIARSNSQARQQQSENANPRYHAQRADYQRAYGVCLAGRDYQVS